MSAYLKRLADFTDVLLLNRVVHKELLVNCEKLRQMCLEGGAPDEPGYRALCWKLLLNFLPPDKGLWEETTKQKRSIYHQFVEDLWINDPNMCENMDLKLLRAIERDIQRTSATMYKKFNLGDSFKRKLHRMKPYQVD